MADSGTGSPIAGNRVQHARKVIVTKSYVHRSENRYGYFSKRITHQRTSTVIHKGKRSQQKQGREDPHESADTLPPINFGFGQKGKPASSGSQSKETVKSRKHPVNTIIGQKTWSPKLPRALRLVENKKRLVLQPSQCRAQTPNSRKRLRGKRTMSEQQWRPVINITKKNTFALPTTSSNNDWENRMPSVGPEHQIVPVHNNFLGGNYGTVNIFANLPTMEEVQTPLNSPDNIRTQQDSQSKYWRALTSSSPRDQSQQRQIMIINKVSLGEDTMHYLLQPRTSPVYQNSSPPEKNQPARIGNFTTSKLPPICSSVPSSLDSKPVKKMQEHWLQTKSAAVSSCELHGLLKEEKPLGAYSEEQDDCEKFGGGIISPDTKNNISGKHTPEEWRTASTASESDSVAEMNHLFEQLHIERQNSLPSDSLARATTVTEREKVRRVHGSDEEYEQDGVSTPNEDNGSSRYQLLVNYYEQCPDGTSEEEGEAVDSRSSTPRRQVPQGPQEIEHALSATSSLSSLFSREYDDIGSLPCSPFYRRGLIHRRSSSIDSAMSRPGSDLLEVPLYVTNPKDRLPGSCDSIGSGDSPIASPVSVLSDDIQHQVVHRVHNPCHVPVTPCHSPEETKATDGDLSQQGLLAAAAGTVQVAAPAVSLTTDDGDDFAVWFGRRGSIFIEDKGGQQPLMAQTTTGEDGKVSLAVPRSTT